MRASPGWPELYIAEAFAVYSRPPSTEGHRRSAPPKEAALDAFFFAWNEYLYAVLLLQGEKMITLPVGMGNFLTSDDSPWNLLMALSVIYSIPPVIFYYIFRRYLTHGLVSGAVQGT